ncbi:MAG: hypothetical protein KDA28_07125 [Phycisphaerales bacterium]|nr:hypothetical protein [Phycisphaerales bacterium]
MRHAPPHAAIAFVSASLLASLSGCMVQDNERLTLGTHTHLAAIDKDPDAATQASGDLQAIHRRQWRPMTYLVPVDGTAHRHLYRTNASGPRADERQRGEHPDAHSALTRTESSDAMRMETIMGPIWCFYDVIRMPVMLFLEPQSDVVYSPLESYERMPR